MKTRIVALGALVAVGALAASAWYFFNARVAGMDPRLVRYTAAGVGAFVSYWRGDYRAAAQRYREHYTRHDAAVLANGDASRRQLAVGDLPAAHATVQQRLAENPQDPELTLTLAEVELARRNLEWADEVVAPLLADQTRRFHDEPTRYLPQHEAWLVKAALEARRNSFSNARAALQTFTRESRPSARFSLYLTMLEVLGELEASPTGREQWGLRAALHQYLALYDRRQYEHAVASARRAIALGRDADEAFVVLGVSLARLGQRDAALESLGQALERNPKNAEAALQAARLYADRGDPAREEQLLKQAQAAAPTERRYLDAVLGALMKKPGEHVRALEIAGQFLEQRPDDEQGLYWAGTLHAALGDFKRSTEYFARVVELDPEDKTAREGIVRNLRAAAK